MQLFMAPDGVPARTVKVTVDFECNCGGDNPLRRMLGGATDRNYIITRMSGVGTIPRDILICKDMYLFDLDDDVGDVELLKRNNITFGPWVNSVGYSCRRDVLEVQLYPQRFGKSEHTAERVGLLIGVLRKRGLTIEENYRDWEPKLKLHHEGKEVES